MTDIKTILIAFGYIAVVIGIATLISKLNMKSSKEITRKFIHIMVGNWVFLYPLYQTVLGIVFVPFMFIIINTISLKYALIEAMEREENDGYGTVYYAISLTILSLFAKLMDNVSILTIGILIMAYGDGFAAVIGKKYGKNWNLKKYPNKSLPGSLTVFIVALTVTFGSLIILKDSPWTYTVLTSIMVAIFAVFLELEGNQGVDNLTLPLGTSYLAYLSMDNPSLGYFGVTIGLIVIFVVAYKKHAITIDGIIMGLFIGLTIYKYGGFYLLMNLIAFFVLGSLVSKIQNDIKSYGEKFQEHTGPRNWVQVCSNALPVAVLTLMLRFMPSIQEFKLIGFALFATCFADTFASELGMLSKGKVVSITRFKPLQPGVSGGVTLMGTLAGLLGSIISSVFAVREFGLYGFVFVSIMGFVGMIIDSVLGDIFQRKYKDETGNLRDFTLDSPEVGGVKFISNNAVNFISLILIIFLSVILV